MDRNHLETSKKGRDQKGMALFPQWAEVIAQLWEFPPERSEAWTLNWDSRHRAPVPGSGPTSHPAVKSARFLSARETEPTGGKTTIFPSKGPKHRSLVHSHSPWAWVKGGRCGLESTAESLGWEALEKDVGEWFLESQYKDIPPYCHSHFSWGK